MMATRNRRLGCGSRAPQNRLTPPSPTLGCPTMNAQWGSVKPSVTSPQCGQPHLKVCYCVTHCGAKNSVRWLRVMGLVLEQ
jgi:hypothetical protein